jgi:hypothetical protein
MTHVTSMLATHPAPALVDREVVDACITACSECALTCTSCADACLAEEAVGDLRRCIRLNLDCADVCDATGHVLMRQTEPDWTLVRAQLQACAQACRTCAEECERHAGHHEHCRVCAEACRRCAEACDALLAALPVG